MLYIFNFTFSFSMVQDTCRGSSITCQNGGYPNPSDCTKCLCKDIYGGDRCEKFKDKGSAGKAHWNYLLDYVTYIFICLILYYC